jgi:hypothetical protein
MNKMIIARATTPATIHTTGFSKSMAFICRTRRRFVKRDAVRRGMFLLAAEFLRQAPRPQFTEGPVVF